MPGTWLNFPFDEELFFQLWQEEPDPVLTAILNSGAMVQDPVIASRIQHDGNLYTVPHYNTLTGEPVNYDGKTDITSTKPEAGSQSGIVYGRAKGFTSTDFVAELSGSDPMGHIISSVSRYWAKYRQRVMLGISNAVLNVSDNDMKKHTINLADGTLEAPHKIEATTVSDAAVKISGDHADAFTLAIMHSHVANTLRNIEVLEFRKFTDSLGMQRQSPIADINGRTVVIDDGVPYTPATDTQPAKYTTYIFGRGVLRQANARIDHPVEVSRDPAKNGGEDTLYTRFRETIHPNGFTYKVPTSNFTQSPTDEQLFAPARWSRVLNAKAIPIGQIITNG